MKLYDIVIVRHPDYRHYGEILSLRIPDDTFMVRMVPGHPGTLCQIPAARLMPANKIKWVHYAEVNGHGSFPIDMLRYDFAAPLNFSPETKKVNHSFGFDGMVVVTATCHRNPRWTTDRWASFNWSIRPIRTVPFPGEQP
jgi:hypothetical protein